jgi:hypothetical protein
MHRLPRTLPVPPLRFAGPQGLRQTVIDWRRYDALGPIPARAQPAAPGEQRTAAGGKKGTAENTEITERQWTFG